MGRELLTLAITHNVRDNSYSVICFDYNKEEFIPLELSQNDIEGKGGIYFDIGAITEVEALREKPIIYPVGEKRIIKMLSKQEMKGLLDRKRMNIERFYQFQAKERYSIVKVNRVVALTVKDTRVGVLPIITFKSDGVEKKNVYINDYKWVQYVRALVQQEKLDEIKKYEQILRDNDSKKEIFLIMNKPINQKGKLPYIVGIHYL